MTGQSFRFPHRRADKRPWPIVLCRMLTFLLIGVSSFAVPLRITSAPLEEQSLSTGAITGVVTSEATGAPLSGIEVCAWLPGNRHCALTDVFGIYTITGLAPDSYMMAFIDAAGNYVSDYYSWHYPDLVAVTDGMTTPDIDAALPTAGRITGVVTSEATGAPLSGIEVITGYPFTSGSTDANGVYSIGGLPPGSHNLSFYDPTGYYASKDYPTLVPVTAGATTANIDAALAVAPGDITGVVTSEDTGVPLSGIQVCAIDPNDPMGWPCASTDAAGVYHINVVASGAYRVRFYNSAGDYVTEFYNDQLDFADAEVLTVGAGATLSNINAALAAAGHITGMVTDEATGAPLSGVSVWATLDIWGGGSSATTDATGAYNIGGLLTNPSTRYRVHFMGGTSYSDEYYDNKADWATATLVAVTTGATVSNINAALAKANPTAIRLGDFRAIPVGATIYAAIQRILTLP